MHPQLSQHPPQVLLVGWGEKAAMLGRHVLLREAADPRSPVIKNTFVSCWRKKLLFGCTLKNRLSTKIQYTLH